MENDKICPICGCKEIGKGRQYGQGSMEQINVGIFAKRSEIIADICTSCGYILSMRVKDPEKFKE